MGWCALAFPQGVSPSVPRAAEDASPTQEWFPEGRNAAATSWSWEEGIGPAWEALSWCTGRGQRVGSAGWSPLNFFHVFPFVSCGLVKAKDLKQV